MYLKAAKVPLNEYEFPVNKIANVQSQLENLVATRHYIHQSAKDGYRSYLQAYASYSSKSIFDINKLDLSQGCEIFWLSCASEGKILGYFMLMLGEYHDWSKSEDR